MSGLAIQKEPLFRFSGIHNNGVYSFHYDSKSSLVTLIIKADKMREKIFSYKVDGEVNFSPNNNLIPVLLFKLALLDSSDLDNVLNKLDHTKIGKPTIIQVIHSVINKCGSESQNPATRTYFLHADMEAKSFALMCKRAEDKKYADDYERCREYLNAMVLTAHQYYFDYYTGNTGVVTRFMIDESSLMDKRADIINNALWFPDHPYHQQVAKLLQFIVVDGQNQAWIKDNHGNLGDQVYEYYKYQKQRNPTTLQVIIDHLNWPGHRKFSPKWSKEEIDKSIEETSARQLEELHQSFRQIQITTSSEEKAWTNAALPD